MRRTLAILTVLVLFAATGAAGMNPQVLISTDTLAQNLGRRGWTVLEIGDRATFEQGHIPGARFVALADIVVDRNGIPNELPAISALEHTFGAAGVSDRAQIVIYSRELLPATRAFFTLDYLGLGRQIAVLDGGYGKWIAENRRTEKGAEALHAVSFIARPNPDVLVDIGQMRILVPAAQSLTSELAVIDARPIEQYDGAQSGPGIVKPGHIPGAMNVPWNANLTNDSAPVFRSANDLRKVYEDRGVPLGGSVIVYCRTGMQASVTYLVMRYLGVDAHLYDGSYAEWNCAEGTSVWAINGRQQTSSIARTDR